MKKRRQILFTLVTGILLSLACNLPYPETTGYPTTASLNPSQVITPILDLFPDETNAVENVPIVMSSPTSELSRTLPPLRTEAVNHTVQFGETLQLIAANYTIGINAIIEANDIENPDLIHTGQVLTIPAPQPVGTASDFRIIPDSELVMSPATAGFDVEAYIASTGGYLSTYTEYVGNTTISSAQIVRQVAEDYSINPRLLLALVEYQSGWLTQSNIPYGTHYPLGSHYSWLEWLDPSLRWAANKINYGYYAWNVNALNAWVIGDEDVYLINPVINSGTSGLQYVLGLLNDTVQWQSAISSEGFYHTYMNLFGDPFQYTFEPILPADLSQPTLQLPFEDGISWSFTGGPHGSWGSGSAWGALDFAPPSDAAGCLANENWVVAMADGLVVRSDRGEVVQDLDGDGMEQTGWSILYLHIETRDRVGLGTYLHAGERIGHPSCEGGGTSTGTHVHIARRYNGEWISADGSIPFVMDGWVSSGTGTAYDGYLRKEDQIVEAWGGAHQGNQIQR